MSTKEIIMPIHKAIKAGDIDEVIRLIGGDEKILHLWTPFGTWLHDAATYGKLDIVRWLVSQGVDLNAYDDSNENTPLCDAASEGHVPIVEFLIESGVTLNVSDSVRNPLIAAIVGGHSESHTAIARMLIGAGIDTTIKYNGENMKNMDALAFAEEWGRSEIVDLLKSRDNQ